MYFARVDADIAIGWARHLPAIEQRLRASFALTIPGGQALEHWFHDRYEPHARSAGRYDRVVLSDASDFHRDALSEANALGGNLAGVLAAIRARSPRYADIERAWNAGTPLTVFAQIAGEPHHRLYHEAARMRRIGFELAAR